MPKKPSSEYASLSPSKQALGDVSYQSMMKESEIIEKITAKYDSLEKLRGSLEEKLDLNEDDDDNGNEEERPHRSINVYRFNQEDNVCPSEQELSQVESFFSGHKTSVYVCPSIISVYFSTLESTTLPVNGMGERKPVRRIQSSWQLMHSGIPLLLLDMGETKSRSKRRIQIVVAERGTGFLLWRDIIDNLTNYQAVDSHFHTMFMSCDHRKLVGLSFHSVSGAREFYEKVERLTADPANISLSSPNSKAAKKKQMQAMKKQQALKKQQQKREKLLKKSDISQPCCFQHLTRLEMADKDYYVTLATLTGNKRASKVNSEEKSELLHKYKSEPSLRIHSTMS